MQSVGRHRVLLPAAGQGTRFGGDLPKQFRAIDGQETVLEQTVGVFLACPWVDQVVVVISPHETRAVTLAGLQHPRVRVIAEGGSSRRDTVLNGVRWILEQPDAREVDWIWVHDAARPWVPRTCLETLRQVLPGEPVGALLALPVVDTVKRAGGPDAVLRSIGTVPRDALWLAQTPQTFRAGPLVDVLQTAVAEGWPVTDEASAFEACGRLPRLVPGHRSNRKITLPSDLDDPLPSTPIPEAIDMTAPHSPSSRPAADPARTAALPIPEFRVGQGFDVHALVPDRPLILGGVRIEHPLGLLGHSDADVLLHAITDAVLGGAGLGDIGRMFPDTDPTHAGADSHVLLATAAQAVRRAGWQVLNIDATVIAQAPKIAPHVAQMQARIADALDIPADRVNVKGKTTEKLGFTGRREGIAAQAVAMLVRAQDQ